MLNSDSNYEQVNYRSHLWSNNINQDSTNWKIISFKEKIENFSQMFLLCKIFCKYIPALYTSLIGNHHSTALYPIQLYLRSIPLILQFSKQPS